MADRATTETPEISYLAKDYASFRRLMLDRLAALLPGGVEDQPADLQVALVELLAYAADRLSYYQDAVATEAYLGTARSRVSLRRHARLLDYPLHEGCNARVWLCCAVEADTQPGNDWRFLTGGASPLVFEPCHRPPLYQQHNVISIGESVLACGATSATLVSQDSKKGALQLKRGDLLLFASTERADAVLRHIVRLTDVSPLGAAAQQVVKWSDEDTLPFDLPVRGSGPNLAVARGNIVLADHGRTIRDQSVEVSASRTGLITSARLSDAPLTYAERLPDDFVSPPETGPLTSAAGLLRRDPHIALPVIGLEGATWEPRGDLIASDGGDRAFVVETEHDGGAWLRFGDNIHGRRPATGSFTARYRVGNGRAGNVGAGMIRRVEAGEPGRVVTEVMVTNPLPARGGEEPEPGEQVRLFAPQAFQTQERAVAAADYAAKAQELPGVQKVDAAIRWTGSWYTVYLFVDRSGGQPVDDDFKRRLRAHLERYRLAGYDLEICGPTKVPLEIVLSVEVKAGFTWQAVKAALADALGSGKPSARQRGFFHPDSWTFGQPVYLSKLYQAALAVPGVASVDATTFCRKGMSGGNEARTSGVIAIGPHEIAALDAPTLTQDRSQSDDWEAGE